MPLLVGAEMKVILADKYGFCFGVKRAIKLTEKIAQKGSNTITLGPLIHNPLEIGRLKNEFDVGVTENLDSLSKEQNVIIRTHGITKQDLEALNDRNINITDATCPFVSKPQQIVENMSKKGYTIVIFGDKIHPEVKSVMSYSQNESLVISSIEDFKNIDNLPKKVAVVSQTTKQVEKFSEIINYLIVRCYEVRVFNTICNATFENQDAAHSLSKKADVMIVVGGKTSSNTKQLFFIAQKNCKDSYLIESESDLKKEWFEGKKVCGITAGASTPDWIIKKVEQSVIDMTS